MDKYLQFGFWFTPAVLMAINIKIFLVISASLAVLGIFSRIMMNIKRKDSPILRFYRKLSVLAFTMAFLGFLIVFLNYENVPIFSSRFFIALWGVGLLVWAIFVLKYFFIKVPKLKAAIAAKAQFEKYI